jgi:hypothetical protein
LRKLKEAHLVSQSLLPLSSSVLPFAETAARVVAHFSLSRLPREWQLDRWVSAAIPGHLYPDTSQEAEIGWQQMKLVRSIHLVSPE